MKFQLDVKQNEPTFVHPAEETEKGLYFLSNLDQNFAVIVHTIYCFKSDDRGNEDSAEVIKNALSKVLVSYYPLAGRLLISGEGKVIVDCNGEGALFVEAEANCRMEEIGDITKPDPEILGNLVYDILGAKNILEIPPIVAQPVSEKVTTVEYGSCVSTLAQNSALTKGDHFKLGSKKSMKSVLKGSLIKRNEQRRVTNMIELLLKAAETINDDCNDEIQRKTKEAKLVHIRDVQQLTQKDSDLIAHVLKDEGGVRSSNSGCQKIALDVNYKNVESIEAIDEELKEIP